MYIYNSFTKIKHNIMKTILAIMLLLGLFIVSSMAGNDLTISIDNPIVTPAFETAGINLVYTGDDNTNASMTVRYRPSGGTWTNGHPGIWVESFPNRVAPGQREMASRLFHLSIDTTYDVETTFSDPDG